MLAPRLAIVDLETTGMSARTDRVTEIAVLEIDDGRLVGEWSSLINPGIPIPPEIRGLTGISDSMVKDAPGFDAIADQLAELLEGRVLVAHNVRFDYGFLKAEFERTGRSFSAKTLCTARLSRALYPERSGHGLDAIVARHRLDDADRHRASGDARILLRFIELLHRELPQDEIDTATRRLLRQPSLPKNLPPERLAAVPHAPGVYVFLGAGGHPVYIGKSLDLRDRVAAHFSGDYRRDREARISQEIEDLEWHETAGELGALLLEAEWVRERMPAHNARLRRRDNAVALMLDLDRGRPKFPLAAIATLEELADSYGVYSSRQSARMHLIDLVREHELCAKALGLERGSGPCFGYQIRRCRGACCGGESADSHRARLFDTLAPRRFQAWPHDGPLAVREFREGFDEWLVFDRWCFLGRAETESAAREFALTRERRFELENFRILAAFLRRDPGSEEQHVFADLASADQRFDASGPPL